MPEGSSLLTEHFIVGTHPKYGVVVAPTPQVTPHLAHWYLTRETFETVPGRAGFYRLTEPTREPHRRAQQTVRDLRTAGFDVTADLALDPDEEQSERLTNTSEQLRRSRRAHAALTRPAQAQPQPRRAPETRTSPPPRPIEPAPPRRHR